VRVHDGIDNTSAVIGTYCGQQRNLVLYSSESNLFVHFSTLQRTANTQNRGFKGIFEFSESFVKLDFIREFVYNYSFILFLLAHVHINEILIGFFYLYIFNPHPHSSIQMRNAGENDGVHIRGSECDQKILSKKESTGFVYSPNYPFPYVPKVVCRYCNPRTCV
jgi:hypothetical protein